MNFMKSATSLIVNPSIKLLMKGLWIYIYVGVFFYVTYSISLIVMQKLSKDDILSCKSPEFMIQASFLIIMLIAFNYYAIIVTKEINQLTELADSVDLLDKEETES